MKIAKYRSLVDRFIAQLIEVETTDVLGSTTLSLLRELGHQLSMVKEDKWVRFFMLQRFVLEVVRDNAFVILTVKFGPTSFVTQICWSDFYSGFITLLSTNELALLRLNSDSYDQVADCSWIIAPDQQVTTFTVNNRFGVISIGTSRGQVIQYKPEAVDALSSTIESPVESHRLCSSKLTNHGYFSNHQSTFGSVRRLSWSPDDNAIAVAWSLSGWSLWSVEGSLLYFSPGDDGTGHLSPLRCNDLVWGPRGYTLVALLESKSEQVDKDASSTRTDVQQSTFKSHLAVFHIAQSSLLSNPTQTNHRHLLLQTSDRLFYLSRSQLPTHSRSLQSILLPPTYVDQFGPIRYASASPDGTRIGVAGSGGLTVFNCRSQHWQLMSNEAQEKAIKVTGGLCWWNNFLCFCTTTHQTGGNGVELRLQPMDQRFDLQSALGHKLPIPPSQSGIDPIRFIDSTRDCIIILTSICTLILVKLTPTASAVNSSVRRSTDPLCFHPSSVHLQTTMTVQLPDLFTNSSSILTISPTSLLPNASFSFDFSLSPKSSSTGGNPTLNGHLPSDVSSNLLTNGSSQTDANPPFNSLLVNYAGSVYLVAYSKSDQYFNQPFLVASNVELIWLSSTSPSNAQSRQSSLSSFSRPPSSSLDLFSCADDDTGLESVWLYSGRSGLRVWLPLPSLRCTDENDESPALSARRVMLKLDKQPSGRPLTILFDQALLVQLSLEDQMPLRGHLVSKTTSNGSTNSSSSAFLYRHQLAYNSLQIEIKPFLHRIILELLRKNLGANALALCRTTYQRLPHFSQILELLLHEVLEVESRAKSPITDPLLPQAVAFVQEFPNFLTIVAQCARKTEVARWPCLFAAIGLQPTDLFALCMKSPAKLLDSAASYLIIIQSSQPPKTSHRCTMQLLKAAIDNSAWKLACDLLKFLVLIAPDDLESAPELVSRLRRPTGNNDSSRTRSSASTSISPSTDDRTHPTNHQNDDPNNDQLPLQRRLIAMINSTAIELLANFDLTHWAELVTNLSQFILPSSSEGHSNPLVEWMTVNRPSLPRIDDWPNAFKSVYSHFHPRSSITSGPADADLPSLNSSTSSSSSSELSQCRRLTRDVRNNTPSITTIAGSCDQLPLDNGSQSSRTSLSQQASTIVDAETQSRRLRFLFKSFQSADCLDWAGLVAMAGLEDRAGVVKCLATAADQIKPASSLIDGIEQLTRWTSSSSSYSVDDLEAVGACRLVLESIDLNMMMAMTKPETVMMLDNNRKEDAEDEPVPSQHQPLLSNRPTVIKTFLNSQPGRFIAPGRVVSSNGHFADKFPPNYTTNNLQSINSLSKQSNLQLNPDWSKGSANHVPSSSSLPIDMKLLTDQVNTISLHKPAVPSYQASSVELQKQRSFDSDRVDDITHAYDCVVDATADVSYNSVNRTNSDEGSCVVS